MDLARLPRLTSQQLGDFGAAAVFGAIERGQSLLIAPIDVGSGYQ
jgi:hypothetical protein